MYRRKSRGRTSVIFALAAVCGAAAWAVMALVVLSGWWAAFGAMLVFGSWSWVREMRRSDANLGGECLLGIAAWLFMLFVAGYILARDGMPTTLWLGNRATAMLVGGVSTLLPYVWSKDA